MEQYMKGSSKMERLPITSKRRKKIEDRYKAYRPTLKVFPFKVELNLIIKIIHIRM